ncbi:adventurous gliding motility lipoprotein CglC [Archangium lansingense]|uniref:adventurous gliding motility lipoprotein CglC n=1 Tax=Archangium lansingense TaxID=2995310 RepID=UPI003B7D9DBA
MSSRLALLVSAVLLFGGCKVNSDIGKRCLLVKKAPEGSGRESDPVLVTDVSEGQDFISFGSLDCEDLVCVKDADMPLEMADNGQVVGYCSTACVQGELVDPCTITDPDAHPAVKDRMSCRALLLDQKALDDLRQNDPATYQATFGDNNSPYFCAGNPLEEGT